MGNMESQSCATETVCGNILSGDHVCIKSHEYRWFRLNLHQMSFGALILAE